MPKLKNIKTKRNSVEIELNVSENIIVAKYRKSK